LTPQVPPEHAKSTVCVDGQSASVVQAFATQWPEVAQLSSGPQSFADVQAGMQLPDLPFTEHVHSPPEPQTIGVAGAASPMSAQSVSTLHGFCGMAQMPQPVGRPPGPHSIPPVQSALVVQPAEASPGAPESTLQVTFDVALCQLPPLHVATTPQP
jgi:hypothetical protein